MVATIDPQKINCFQQKIFSWWEKNKRSFPWRETTNPYYILVSEVMLQQTQVSRVVDKYLAFVNKFPTLESLVETSDSELLNVWSGLGYNRRAIWLKEAAKQILSLGWFPKTQETLMKLKGIGNYASRSILIFAFNYNIATVDTNIRRIFIVEGFADESTADKELLQIAHRLLPEGRSRDWHNALMDYGATVLTASKTGVKSRSTQGEFEGSNRQYRGIITKYLTEHRYADKETLVKICNISEERIELLINSLITDKLIKKNDNMFYID